jgi:hypothetical protein
LVCKKNAIFSPTIDAKIDEIGDHNIHHPRLGDRLACWVFFYLQKQMFCQFLKVLFYS